MTELTREVTRPSSKGAQLPNERPGAPRPPDHHPESVDHAVTRWVRLGEDAASPDLGAPLTVAGALDFARSPAAASGATGQSVLAHWELLATLACADLGAARAIEPHLDAQSILRDAKRSGFDTPPQSTELWGVFAAEGGSDPLVASLGDAGWTLEGTKPWCSLADRIDRALVTATVPDASSRLFAVDLRDAGVDVEPRAWHARGLSEIPSGPVHFTHVPALPVGPSGWYLDRIGFAWGGIGVAACWFGGAVGIARSLIDDLADRTPSPHQLAHLGAVDELLQGCRLAIAHAARIVDGDPAATREAASILAKRVRATVARACEEIILRSSHALGPAPLALDPIHAKRVADLQLYIRQHHAERDQASLGSALLATGEIPW